MSKKDPTWIRDQRLDRMMSVWDRNPITMLLTVVEAGAWMYCGLFGAGPLFPVLPSSSLSFPSHFSPSYLDTGFAFLTQD